MKRRHLLPALALVFTGTALAADAKTEADAFLRWYNSVYVGLSTAASEGAWEASTNVNDYNEGLRTGSGLAWSVFVGDPEVINTTKALLAQKEQLDPLQVRELENIWLMAAGNPGTISDVVKARVEAESRASGELDGYVFCLVPRAADGSCPEPKVANDIDEILGGSTDMLARENAWIASKDIGRGLKDNLAELVALRNRVAREMGFSSYFDLMVAGYGMDTPEMIALLDSVVTDMDPVYRELHKWAGRQFATKYGKPAPTGPLPAHWLPNRWGQEWGGMVQSANLDPYFKDKSPEWMVKTAEAFYTSMGFEPLPQSFWEKSDLYPAPDANGDGAPDRLKNAHASAWHVDLNHDLRSLMSVKADSNWFFTSHHELGHIYYYVSYTRPEVPPVLREGANRGFHEAVGELISLAAGQVPYLHQVGILPKNVNISTNDALLVDALERTVVFIPWSAGVMTHFEYELYEKELPPDQWQKRWWEMVNQYQGIVPPQDRDDPALCDACTKTHIIDDPAGYYDYAIATVIKHQLHDHICRDIRGEDPHACNYYGDKRVGDFLKGILQKGATEDWRKVIQDATGEPLSTRAMVEYYQPLLEWLKKENKKKAKR